MCKNTLEEHPSPKEITKWFDYVSKNFIYQSSWGLGSLIAVVLNDNDFAPIRPMNIDDWPRAGLPWIAFWMKELFTWGTLEPVAAFLLARGDTKTRGEAEQKAQEYYDSRPAKTYANDLLDPRAIRVWAQETRPSQRTLREPFDFEQLVRLTRERDIYRYHQVYVTPIVVNGGWTWIDNAGYDVAKGPINEDVRLNVEQYEFTLDVSHTKVTGRQYLAYQLP